jgi:hypothetical protein
MEYRGCVLSCILSVLRFEHVPEGSYRDAIENLFTSRRTVLVLSLQVQNLDFLHDYFPLFVGARYNDEISDWSRTTFSRGCRRR